MSLYDQMKNDTKHILTNPNGMTSPMTVTNENGEILNIMGRWTDIGISVDQETGLPVAGRSLTVAFYCDDVSEIYNGNNYKNWTISFINNRGEGVIGEMAKPLIDRTFNYVHSHLVIKK